MANSSIFDLNGDTTITLQFLKQKNNKQYQEKHVKNNRLEDGQNLFLILIEMSETNLPQVHYVGKVLWKAFLI